MEGWRHLDGSGAIVNKPHIHIEFQRGNPDDVGMNGCTMEDVLEVVIQKLLDFQGRKLACRENAVALWHLSCAQEAMATRARARAAQGVRGTSEPHVSPEIEERPIIPDTLPAF
jgi:hypothetical protein